MLKNIGFILLGGIVGCIITSITINKKPGKASNELAKWKLFYYVYDRWLELRQKNILLSSWLLRRGYNKIAIYGGRELGARLFQELQNTEINVAYVIDKNPENSLCKDISIVRPNEKMGEVDAIVITAIYYAEEIKQELGSKVSCDIVSLEELVFNSN